MRAQQNLPIFWNWPPKNIADQQKHVAFRKSQKSDKSLHPTVQYVYIVWAWTYLQEDYFVEL